MPVIMITPVLGAVGGAITQNFLPQEYYIEASVTGVIGSVGMVAVFGAPAIGTIGMAAIGTAAYFACNYFVTPYVVDYVVEVLPEEYGNKEVINSLVSVGGATLTVPLVLSTPILVAGGATLLPKVTSAVTATGQVLRKIDLIGKGLGYVVPKIVGGSQKLTKALGFASKLISGWTVVNYAESQINQYTKSTSQSDFELSVFVKTGLVVSVMYPGVGSFVALTTGSSVSYFMVKGNVVPWVLEKNSLEKQISFTESMAGYYDRHSSDNGLKPYLYKMSNYVDSFYSVLDRKQVIMNQFSGIQNVYHPMMIPTGLYLFSTLAFPVPTAIGLGCSLAAASDYFENYHQNQQTKDINQKLKVTGNFVWTMIPNKNELLTTNGIQALIELSLGTWLHQFDKDPAAKTFVRDTTKAPAAIANALLGNEVGGTGVKYGTGSAISSIFKPVCKGYIMLQQYPGLTSVDISNFANYVCEVPARLLHLLDVKQQSSKDDQAKSFYTFASESTLLELLVFSFVESVSKTYFVSQFSKTIGKWKFYSVEKNVLAEKLKHVKASNKAQFTQYVVEGKKGLTLPAALEKGLDSYSDLEIVEFSRYVGDYRHTHGLGDLVIEGKHRLHIFEPHHYNIAGFTRFFAHKMHSSVTKFLTGAKADQLTTSYASVFDHVANVWKLNTNHVKGAVNVVAVVGSEVSCKIANEAAHMILLSTDAKVMQEVASKAIVASGMMNVTTSNKQAKPTIQDMYNYVIKPSVEAIKDTMQLVADQLPDVLPGDFSLDMLMHQ